MKSKNYSFYKPKFLRRWPVLIIILLAGNSCKKFVALNPPKNQIISSEVFINDNTATSAINGIYSVMMQTPLYLMNGGTTVYPGLSADELSNTATSTTLDPFKNNTLLSSSTVIQNNLWRNAYIFIYQANACIEGLNESSGLTPSVKNQLLGEAKFVRALSHFYLINLFGDVPLIVTTDYTVTQSLPRTAVSGVYDQIVLDLKDAQNLLSDAYPTTGPVRANKWAATALLARVYLYRKDWANAETQASLVINSGNYSLVPLNNVFLAGSKEAILQFIPAPSNNTSEGNTFIPSSATVRPTYALTDYLMSAFDSGDQRKSNWISHNTVGGVVYNYPYKYKVKTSTTITENYMVLRLAEQYLIRAEARANQGKISGSNGAAADINLIRARAGLPPTTANDQSAMLSAIEKERQTELFAEWGHRWFDLKRTGRIDGILGTEKSGWQPYDALYPIPFSEIQKNPFLVQNNGYQ